MIDGTILGDRKYLQTLQSNYNLQNNQSSFMILEEGNLDFENQTYNLKMNILSGGAEVRDSQRFDELNNI